MQKKIIVLAIAAALTAPVLAFAEASVSGQANMSVDMVNNGVSGTDSVWQLNSNQSRIIVKGSDDLGGGMSAMWQADARFSMDTGNAANARLFDGNSFLGLKSDSLGALAVGRIDTAYKSSTRRLDVFYDVAGDNRASLGGLMGRHDSRNDNALNYTSPNLGGVTIAFSTVFGNETATASGSAKGSLISLAAMYEQGGIYATVAIDNKKLGDPATGDLAGTVTTSGDTDNAFKVGGGYKMDAFAVNAIVERQTAKANLTQIETTKTNVYVGGKFNISGTDAVRAAFTKGGASSSGGVTATDDATQLAVGYEHGMSKATSVYASYVKTTANSVANANPSTLSLGMKHAF